MNASESAFQFIGGRLLDDNGEREANLVMENGRVAAIGTPPRDGITTIDASGCLLLPGVIDLAFRTGEPGPPQRATIATELPAAARCGITQVLMPPDCTPPIDSGAVVEWIMERTDGVRGARLSLLGSLTRQLGGEALADMHTLLEAGCVGLGLGQAALADTAFLRSALQYAADCEATVHLQPLDPSLAAGGVLHEGALSTRLGLVGIPSSAETIGLSRLLQLCADTGVRLHLTRLSCAASVRLVAAARKEGLPVSADVSVLHLVRSVDDIGEFDSADLVLPPFRTESDLQALLGALADGVIDAVCSDHYPRDGSDKIQPLPSAAPGASTADALIPLMLGLHADGALPASVLARALCTAPAQILGLPKPEFRDGARIDISLIDPEQEWTFTAATLHSAAHHSPLAGQSLRGRARGSLIDGRWMGPDTLS